MSSLNELNLAVLAAEVKNLTGTLKEASEETSNFKENLNTEPKGNKGNDKDTDPFELALAALGIHVPTDEEMKQKKENHPATSEALLTVSLAIVAATAKVNAALEKAMITTVQTGAYEVATGDNINSKSNFSPQDSTAPRDATKTTDSLYPNDPERPPTALEVAEGYNVLSTKIIPGVASVLLGPAGQAIVSAISYVGDEIKETIGEEVYKKRKAPKNKEEYFEKNKGHFEQEDKNRNEGGKDYYWNQKLHAKKDATDVKIDVDSHLNSSQGRRETQEDYENSNYGYEAGHKRNKNRAGGASRNNGPDPVETMAGVFGEVQKVGEA